MVKVGDKVWVVRGQLIHATFVKSVGTKFIYVSGEKNPFFKGSMYQRTDYTPGKLVTSYRGVVELLEARRADNLKALIASHIFSVKSPDVIHQLVRVLGYPIPALPCIPVHHSGNGEAEEEVPNANR